MSQSASSGYIFHRTREQPAPDPNSPPLNQIKFYLDRYKIKEALQIFFHDNTLRLLRDEPDFMWDIIPLICQRLRGLCQYRFRVFEGCERMLCRIAVDENCNPKEVLISLLAQISQSASSYITSDQQQYYNYQSSINEEDDNVFRAMIRPLEGTLLRMNEPTPRGENYRWVLKVLMRHIDNISLPSDDKLDGKPRLSVLNDPSNKRFIEVLPLVLSFIEDFSEFKLCGSDYDMRSPMPILTKSQIDEVLNGELATGENSDADADDDDDVDRDNDQIIENINNGDRNLEDVNFVFETKPKAITTTTTIDTATTTTTFSDIVSDKNNDDCEDNVDESDDDDDLANFYDDHSSARGDITDASVTALISLLRKPLTFLDLSSYCSDLKLCANRCLNILLEQVPNLFAPVYKRIMKINMFESSCPSSLLSLTTTDDYLLSSNNQNIYSRRNNINNLNNYSTTPSTIHQTPTSTLSLATCSYIFRCERTAQTFPSVIDQSFPQILSPEALLFCYTPYIIILLERPEVLAQEKGLRILESILLQIERDSLDYKYLELFEHSSLLTILFQIMVYSRMYLNRRRAYDLFTNICDLLTHDCKVIVFKKVLGQSEMRPCVRAACIDQYRKHMAIIQRELVNLHRELSFTLSKSTTLNYNNNNDSKSSHLSLKSHLEQTKIEDIENKQHQNDTFNRSDQQQPSATECNLVGQLPEREGQSKLMQKSSTIQGSRCCNNDQPVDNGAQQVCNSLQEACCEPALSSEDIVRQINKWQARYRIFAGKSLVDFLDQCLKACLPDGQHTDLIDNYELLQATLTIFRYLKLRKLITKDEIEEKYLSTKRLKKTLFDPVRSAISLVMTELKSHQKELVSSDNRKPIISTGSSSTKTTVPNTNSTKIKSSKKKSKGNSSAQKLNGGGGSGNTAPTSPLKLSEEKNCERSNGHSHHDLSMLAHPIDLNTNHKFTTSNIVDQQLEAAVVGPLKTDLDEVECINWVMCRIDLIESILVRTSDLYNC